jgi:Kef-type K+ transport system membrane component KefB
VNLPLLLLQVVVILAASRLIGWVFQRMHQPQVVGEMFAGILLGPSLLGAALPAVSAALFPPQTLDVLNALSQIGLLSPHERLLGGERCLEQSKDAVYSRRLAS